MPPEGRCCYTFNAKTLIEILAGFYSNFLWCACILSAAKSEDTKFTFQRYCSLEGNSQAEVMTETTFIIGRLFYYLHRFLPLEQCSVKELRTRERQRYPLTTPLSKSTRPCEDRSPIMLRRYFHNFAPQIGNRCRADKMHNYRMSSILHRTPLHQETNIQ